VMVRSTSTGPSAGTFVSTCTWTLVMSGTASMGSCCALRTPTAATMTTKAKTRRRHFRQSSRSFFMACPSVLVAFGELAAAQRALQREGAADGEARTLIQARSHLEEAACATAERDRLRAEAVRFVGGDEHHRLAIEGRHRVGRDNEHALVRASADQLDAPEETAAKTGVGSLRRHANGQRARALIESGRDVCDGAGHRDVGKRVEANDCGRAR